MSDKNVVVAACEDHTKAEAAILELERAGFDMKKLSIVGKAFRSEEDVIGYYNAGSEVATVPWPVDGWGYTYRLPPTAAVNFAVLGAEAGADLVRHPTVADRMRHGGH